MLGNSLNSINNYISSKFQTDHTDIVVSTHILPAASSLYNLGTQDVPFHDMFLSGNITCGGELIGKGSQIEEVLTNYTTSDLMEGDNMYYTHQRVGAIVSSSNIETINYIDETKSNISNYLKDTSDTLISIIDTNDTNVSNYLNDTSDALISIIDTNDTNISNYLKDTSDAITYALNLSNQMIRTDLQTNMDVTSNIISDRVSKLDADDIAQGENKRFIVNNIWSDDLIISGTLYTSNVRSVGSNTILFTDIYTTESLGVVSTAEDSDAFVISHSGDGIHNVMTATVADEPALVITSQRYIGIGLTNPVNALEVVGITKSSEFIGKGSQIEDVVSSIGVVKSNTSQILCSISNVKYNPSLLSSDTFFKTFNISLFSDTNVVIFSAIIYRIYKVQDPLVQDVKTTHGVDYHVTNSYYQTNTITSDANSITFNGNIVSFNATNNDPSTESISVSLVDNYSISATSM
jgi:hypothetical protein